MIARLFFAATLWLSIGHAQAAVIDPDGPTVTAPEAEVFIFGGVLTATSFDPVLMPGGAFAGLSFVQLATALGPELILQTEAPDPDLLLRAVAGSLDFDGDWAPTFFADMQVVEDVVEAFGPSVRVTLVLNDPFDPSQIYEGTGSLTVQNLLPDDGVEVIPLPATLPLLLAGIGGFGALRRARRA